LKHINEIKEKLKELKEEEEELEDMLSYITTGHEELKTQLKIDKVQINAIEEVLTKYKLDPDIVAYLLNVETTIRDLKEKRKTASTEDHSTELNQPDMNNIDIINETIWKLEQEKDILEWVMRSK
jgi:chromosome segregation ATPase